MSLNSPQNYSIGKAYVAFRLKGTTQFLPLGNVPSFVYEPEIENLEHFSSQVGPRVKDADVVQQVGANVNLTLDEITAQNLAMAVNGTITTLTQDAVIAETVNVGNVVAEQVVDLGYLNITSVTFVDDQSEPLVENVDYRVISAEAGVYVFTHEVDGVVATVTAGELTSSAKRSVVSILSSPEGVEGEFLIVGTGTGRKVKGTGIYANLKSSAGVNLISDDFMELELTGAVLAQPGDHPFGKFEQLN